MPNSVLFLGRPGVGKTTVIREMARVLADDLRKRVVSHACLRRTRQAGLLRPPNTSCHTRFQSYAVPWSPCSLAAVQVIVDTSNEIGGDGDVPHPAIGGARRMQVPDPSQQHRVMVKTSSQPVHDAHLAGLFRIAALMWFIKRQICARKHGALKLMVSLAGGSGGEPHARDCDSG